jgi:hypothetical protein
MLKKIVEEVFDGWASAFKIVSSYIIGSIALAFCLVTAWSQGDTEHRHLQILICIMGGVLGWILGLYITPLSETEEKRFSEFGKAFAGLVSGFSLAKSNEILLWIGTEFGGDPNVRNLRLLLFLSCLFIGALFTYISRLFVRGNAEARNEALNKVVAEIDAGLQKLKQL